MFITLRQLQYTIAVAETGSFSKAAEICAAEQSTVSQQIKAMEERLGVLVFDRGKQPIHPTEEGAKIVAQAIDILNKVDELVRPFKKPYAKSS